MSRVLLRNDDERKLKFSSVMFGRTLFSVLGVLALATVVGTIIIDGFPFQKELLTPIATCAYIVRQLFQLSYQDSMYHILLDSHSKHGSTFSK
uniref:Uncharacterized protein LOC109505211 isoform X2 n=1 Tax=Elaeis guineensis var. tenera TaxID=51953 RepID=A0A6J0PDA2_ELAGV|nr:uncharacterized protein LOC109505211 isoform X2 [Elaeis guineensis]